MTQNFFTEARVHAMLKTIVASYIILTNEELLIFNDDPLRFYLIMKGKSNEVKGNYLRDHSKGFIGGIRLRFDQHYSSFCLFLKQQLNV
mmetsp:Transcript_39837/g.29392  ORF Transcript_39837/g.29392 Transcript_39837/m.29392 type:complete len:89 (-) Transcript_39837:454-720(-)